MSRTVDYREFVPDAVTALRDIESAITGTAVDESLLELVKIRASQINGCAFCVDLHTERARELGMDDRRIAAVAAWRESPFFDDRERAAFQLTEALTRLSDEIPDDSVFEDVHEQFDDEAVAGLVMAINAINCWNRLWVSFQTPAIPELGDE